MEVGIKRAGGRGIEKEGEGRRTERGIEREGWREG